MKSFVFGKGFLLLILSLLLIAGPALAGPVIKIGHVAPPFHGQHIGLEHFSRYLAEHSDGRFRCKVFPSGQLGGERSLAEQVQTGTLPMAVITTAVLSNFVPQIGVVDLPFLFPDRRTAYAVLDSPIREKLFACFPPKGFVALTFMENEFRDLTNSKHPIRKPEDLKGLKIRTMESPIFIDTFKTLGAEPVPMPFPEVYNALEQGVIDGQDNPLFTSILVKFTEVNHFVTRSQHVLTATVLVANRDFWGRLKPADQELFQTAAYEAMIVNRAVNLEGELKLPRIGLSIPAYLREKKLDYVELTPAERQRFRQAVDPVYKKYRAKIGPAIFDAVLDQVKKQQTGN
ncbi:MAG: DctP family TRAP transporter solute-binding subunit [Deltaproteobacteria bacterium]|nr:DctP family TRAP transporter solute-binding subunit [Deltaproteobacteria bacterium]